MRYAVTIAALLWTTLGATPVAIMGATPGLAADTGTYTDFTLEACKQLTPTTSGEEGESSGIFECPGHAGIPVTFTEGDLRSFVAFGPNGQNHCAFHQTFSGFNSIGKKIEWRMADGKPIASIFRWTVSYDPEDATKTKTWLVVSRIESGQSCHMGYVEGSLPSANEKARALVAQRASGFSCATDAAIFVTNTGANTEGIVSGGCAE